MSERRCGDGAPWCARADVLFNAPGLHVLEVTHETGGRLVVTVESDEVLTGAGPAGWSQSASAAGSTASMTLQRSGRRC